MISKKHQNKLQKTPSLPKKYGMSMVDSPLQFGELVVQVT
jgi:hypothetical protein